MSSLNINDHVRIKITPFGWGVFDKHDSTSAEKAFHELPSDDYTELQLWRVMQIFGGTMGNGSTLAFETAIEIIEK